MGIKIIDFDEESVKKENEKDSQEKGVDLGRSYQDGNLGLVTKKNPRLLKDIKISYF